jgi:hypothetical protein
MSAPLTPNKAEAGFWLILLLGLVAGIGLETDWGRKMRSPVPENAEKPPEFAKPVLAEPFRLPASDRFLEVTARPLFVATRRPAPSAPTADSGKPSMKKDQFILMGTAIVPEGSFAFLLEKAGNRSRVVARGKEINGILLREVSADRVLLAQDDEWEVLELKTRKPPAAPVATTPPGPAAVATPPSAAAPRPTAPLAPAGVATPPATAAPPVAAPPAATPRTTPPPATAPGAPPPSRPRIAFPWDQAPAGSAAKGQAPQPAGSAQ